MSTNYFKQEIVTPPAAISNGAHKRQTLESVIYSYDKNISKLIIPVAVPKCKELDFENVETIKVLLTVMQDGKEKKIEDTASIEKIHRRHISYIISDRLNGYQGNVKMNIYLDLKNGQQIDLAEYGFTMVRSAIDQDIPEIEDFYFKSLDDVIIELKQKTEAAWQEVAGDLSEIHGSIDAVNEKVNQLDSKADEISDQIANNDFRNFIMGKEISINEKATMIGKVSGSTVENPHRMYSNMGKSILNPSQFNYEIGTTSYSDSAELDNKIYTTQTSAAEQMRQVGIAFDVISDIERKYQGIFETFSAVTQAQKVAVARKIVDGTIHPVAHVSGSGPHSTNPGSIRTQVNMQIWGTTWHGGALNTTSKIAMLEYKNQTGQRIQDDGCVYIILYAPASDGSTPSIVNIDQVYLEYQIKFKMSDIYAIKSAAQMNKVTQDNGDALIKVSDTETILDRVLASGAGFKTGEATGKTADAPTTSNTRLTINMVNATAGSVTAIDTAGVNYTRVISGSAWRDGWKRQPTAKEFEDLVAKVTALESKVK